MFHCDECNTDLRFEDEYNVHLQGITRPFECSKCRMIFSSLCIFETHKRHAHAHMKLSPPEPRYLAVEDPPQDETGAKPGKPGTGQQKTTHPQRPDSRRSSASAATRKVSTGQRPNPQRASGGESKSKPFKRREENRPNKWPRSEPSSSSQPQSSLEGNLIDLETSMGDGEDQYETIDDAITKFQEIVKMRQGTVGQKTDQIETRADMLLKARPGGYAMLHRSGADPSLATGGPTVASNADVTPKASPNIACSECEAAFSSVVHLQDHQISYGHNACVLCRSIFTDRDRLEKHHRRVHDFRCLECPESFTSEKRLLRHQRAERHAYCAACDCFFTHRKPLAIHLVQFHGYDIIGYKDGDYDNDDVSRGLEGQSPTCDLNVSTRSEEDEVINSTAQSGSNDAGDEPGEDSGVDEPLAHEHLYKCDETDCTFSSYSREQVEDHRRLEGHHYCVLCNTPSCHAGPACPGSVSSGKQR